MSSNYQQKKKMNALGAIDTKGKNGNFKNVDTAMPVESLDDLEQYRSDRLTDKVTSLKDSLDAQYKADERGRVFDRPCQVLDDGDLDEH